MELKQENHNLGKKWLNHKPGINFCRDSTWDDLENLSPKVDTNLVHHMIHHLRFFPEEEQRSSYYYNDMRKCKTITIFMIQKGTSISANMSNDA